mgnify:CR=1 FL=1
MEIPEWMIRRIVGNSSVAESDETIRELIEAPARAQVERKAEGWLPEHVKQCGDYAVKVHHENQELYLRVMRGGF